MKSIPFRKPIIIKQMKIQLVNFGCWTNETFEFNSEGMNLLSGPSGYGKSTVLRAIIFALFGKGRKIIREGCSSCKVQLWFKDMHIVRSKGPGRLIVNDVFEDEIGQKIIDERMGDPSMAYLEQNGRNTFLNMTPLQKLEYLEEVSFAHCNVSTLKDKLKKKQKRLENDRLSLDTRANVCRETIDSFVIPPKVDLSVYIVNGVSDEIYEREEQCSKLHEIYEKHNGMIDKLESYNVSLSTFTTTKEKYETQITDMEKLSTEFQSKIDKYESNIIPGRQEELTDELDNITRNEELLNLRKQYDKQKNIYETSIGTEKKEITESLNTYISALEDIPFSLEELNEKINTYKLYLDTQNTLDNLIMERDGIEFDSNILDKLVDEQECLRQSIINFEQYRAVYECPNCECTLKMENKCLVHVDRRDLDLSDVDDTISKMTESLTKMSRRVKMMERNQNNITSLDSKIDKNSKILKSLDVVVIDDDLLKMELYKEKTVKLVDSIEELSKKKKEIRRKYKLLEKDMSRLETRCNELEDLCTPVERSKDDINKELKKIFRIQTRLDEYINLRDSNNRKYDKLVVEYDSFIESFQFQTFPNSITEYRDQCMKCTTTIKNLTLEISELRDYSDYTVKNNEYTVHCKKYQSLLDQMEYVKKEFATCVELKTFISKAETLAIQSTIDTINANVQIFLDAFFVEDPMIAQLVPIKSKGMKTEKRQLHIDILYKGMSTDPSILSGGEYDRLTLAFMLSLMEFNNSPLILLDECISSLDQDTADDVCSFIHSHNKGRCVVLIAHQIITGIFDTIIDIRKHKPSKK